MNLKRIERLWRAEGLRGPPRRVSRPGGKGPGGDENSAWARPALAPGHTWSYDFMSLTTVDGRPMRLLNVVDEYTRLGVGFHVARSIGARAVVATLGQLIDQHRAPAVIRSDNGREFVAEHVSGWLSEHGIAHAPIAKGCPQQNCYVERFIGTTRDELLDGEVFHSVLEARVVLGRWCEQYNTERPHRALGMLTPLAFDRAERARLRDDRASNEGGG